MLNVNCPKLLILLITLIFTGCVTTTNAPQVDEAAAHDKRIQLGKRYLVAGDRDKARWQFNKALDFDKNSAQAVQGLAMVHQANGEMEPAGKQFKRALKLADEKELAAIELSYGQYLFENDQFEEACTYFEKAAADYDYASRPQALYFAGQCALKTGNPKRMVAAFEHAINLQPDFSPALIELAEVYFLQGEYTKAKKMLDQYERTAKNSAKSIWLGIRIERIFGNKDREASYVIALKNLYPYSKEYLAYKEMIEQAKSNR